MKAVLNYFFLLLVLWLWPLSLASNAQTTVDPVTGQVSIVIDPATGQTLTVTQNQPLEEIQNDPGAINVSPWLGDDGSYSTALPFTFELYGQQFNSVVMMSNGVLSFTGQGGSYCCNGEDISMLADTNQTHHNYIIAAAWSDLLTPGENAYYLGSAESATFGWYGVYEFYDPNNLNSFEIELYSLGNIDIRYGGMDITGHTVSSGVTGDLSQDEFVDLYYGSGFNLGTPINPDPGGGGGGPDPCDLDPLSSPSCPGYQQAYYNQQCSANPLYDVGCPGYQQAYYNQQCSINPLYNSGCPGYTQAYYNQQCSINALYDAGCPGYQQAYYNQQCSINPLYASDCPGYQQAYYNQQCSINSLYDTGCPGYAQAYYNQQCSADPLYDVGCSGYQQAYYNQQCLANALYDTGCPGYAQAYYNQQCSINALYDSGCAGYAQAYYNQQCAADPLYDTGCPGYAQAYYNQQCSISALYDSGCPGYQQAYYNQQCQLDTLYDSGCPGYAQAYYNQQCSANALYDAGCPGYAQAYYNQQCSNSPLYDSGCPGYTEAVFQQNCTQDQLFSPQCPGFSVAMAMKIAQEQQEQMFSQELTPSATTYVEEPGETTGDPVLDQLLSVLPEPIELASMQDEIVQTVAVEEVAATEPVEEPTPEDEAAAEEMMAELVGESSEEGEESSSSDEKPSPEKQKAAVAAKIAELKKELASGEMSAKDVAAIQAQLSLLLAFVPGFDQYYIVIPDAPFYEQEQAYQNVTIPDTKNSIRLGLASEMKFEEMVKMQYDRRQ